LAPEGLHSGLRRFDAPDIQAQLWHSGSRQPDQSSSDTSVSIQKVGVVTLYSTRFSIFVSVQRKVTRVWRGSENDVMCVKSSAEPALKSNSLSMHQTGETSFIGGRITQTLMKIVCMEQPTRWKVSLVTKMCDGLAHAEEGAARFHRLRSGEVQDSQRGVDVTVIRAKRKYTDHSANTK
jgi:hypothetical protein